MRDSTQTPIPVESPHARSIADWLRAESFRCMPASLRDHDRLERCMGLAMAAQWIESAIARGHGGAQSRGGSDDG